MLLMTVRSKGLFAMLGKARRDNNTSVSKEAITRGTLADDAGDDRPRMKSNSDVHIAKARVLQVYRGLQGCVHRADSKVGDPSSMIRRLLPIVPVRPQCVSNLSQGTHWSHELVPLSGMFMVSHKG